MQGKYTTKSAKETIELGQKLGEVLTGGELILLYGDLGAGKTQFTKGVALGLCIADTVVSPTFTIERIYQGKRLMLHHLDLYRTQNDREILEQITESIDSPSDITVVEWPENMSSLEKFNHFQVVFEELSDNERKITLIKKGEQWS